MGLLPNPCSNCEKPLTNQPFVSLSLFLAGSGNAHSGNNVLALAGSQETGAKSRYCLTMYSKPEKKQGNLIYGPLFSSPARCLVGCLVRCLTGWLVNWQAGSVSRGSKIDNNVHNIPLILCVYVITPACLPFYHCHILYIMKTHALNESSPTI